MATDYRVQRGDCISSIAHAFNLSWETVWNHPNNADLKKARKDPNILKEGDIVHVPDLEQKQCEVATGAVHRFKVKKMTAQLKLRIVEEPPPTGKPQEPPAPSPDRKNAITEDP